MMQDGERVPFYQEFRDSALNVSRRRGLAAPTWDDVLVAQTEFPQTNQIWGQRGVYTPGVSTDVRFSLLFGRPLPLDPLPPTAATLLDRAKTELLEDISGFQDREDILSQPGSGRAARRLLGSLRRYLHGVEEDLSNPNVVDERKLKGRILKAGIDGFLTHVSESARGDHSESGMNRLASEFLYFMTHRDQVIITDHDPISILDTIGGGGAITPFRLVEITQQQVDPFLKYILHRNGLTAPKEYEAPCRMPDPAIIKFGLGAFNFVENHRQEKVLPAHILPELLLDPEVLAIVRQLDKEESLSEREEGGHGLFGFGDRSGRNFLKLRSSVIEQLVPSRGNEERFRHIPEISEVLRFFLAEANSIVNKGLPQLGPARLMGMLLKDASVRGILVKAGLKRTQLRGWNQAVTQRGREKEEEKKIKGRALEDRVDDRELNELLEKYSIDLSKAALEGKLDPVIEREEEIRQMMRILLQRGRSNPLILGEPGVGKSVLFGGLAHAIASGNAPSALLGAKVFALDLAAMGSDAMYRGQFEGRLLPIIKGVAERNLRGDEPPILLCIDEIHSALKSGTAMGIPGASELLKPYLTRGELSIIGATTQADFARDIETDAALTRRFQTVFIDEPKPEQTLQILQGLKDRYASHHGIKINDDLLELIVQLTDRYLPSQRQPDKSQGKGVF